MTVLYLDVDDEITDAVARLRTAQDGRMVLVLPPSSRVATSRINFRLLAREARERDVLLAVVSGEPGVRALAISAGLPAHETVDESEQALAAAAVTPPAEEAPPAEGRLQREGSGAARAPRTPGSDPPGAAPTVASFRAPPPGPAPRAEAPAAGVSGQPGVQPPGDVPRGRAPLEGARPAEPASDTTRPMATVPSRRADRSAPPGTVRPGDAGARGYGVTPRVATSAAGAAATAAEPGSSFDTEEEARARRSAKARPRRRGVLGILVRLAILAALIGGAVYAAYLFLPSASILLHPRTEVAGPVTFEATADPRVAVPDAASGVIPAARIEIPVTATGQFPATGSEVTQTRATGTVRFTSENTLFDVPIPEGTRLATSEGVEFQTVESVVVPTATFEGGPTSVEARIRAAEGGPSGNVPADAITDVPESVSAALVTVTNPSPTSGGTRSEVPVVTRQDYDRALASLTERLEEQLAAALEDPATTPRGLVLYPSTADLGRVTADTVPGDVVETQVETFSLMAESVATVVAVNEALLEEVAAERLAEAVPSDYDLFPETVRATSSPGEVRDGVVVYQVTAQGERYRAPDREALLEAVRGRSLPEARAILEEYGSVEITLWPEFIGTMPDQAGRISLSIVDPERRDA